MFLHHSCVDSSVLGFSGRSSGSRWFKVFLVGGFSWFWIVPIGSSGVWGSSDGSGQLLCCMQVVCVFFLVVVFKRFRVVNVVLPCGFGFFLCFFFLDGF